MIKRAWFLISVLWAFAFIGNGLTKADGVQDSDFFLALAPFVAGFAITRAGRYVLTGSFRKPRTIVYCRAVVDED